MVAGRNFGTGSSREQVPGGRKHLSIAALIAPSSAGLFYRNAVNLDLPAVVCAEAKRIRAGDELALDFTAGRIENRTTGEVLA